jgi:hypothetical protein
VNRIPFSVYDFFGYLASGFLLVVTVDYVIGDGWVLHNDLGVTLGVFWLLVSYITGQIIASPASFFLERLLVGKGLKRPSTNLLQERPRTLRARPLPGHYTPLPKPTRERVQGKAKAAKVNETGEALFIHAFGEVKKDEKNMPRLNTFLNLYGFCRNISFTCLLVTIMIVAGSLALDKTEKLYWALASMAAAVGMLYRYLKFFRQYAYELFITYAAQDDEGGESGD